MNELLQTVVIVLGSGAFGIGTGYGLGYGKGFSSGMAYEGRIHEKSHQRTKELLEAGAPKHIIQNGVAH
jgi:hypothetical protein